MTTYKYTDSTNTVVHVIDDDGISRSSCLASTLPEGSVVEPYIPTPAELNAPIMAQLDEIDVKKVRALTDALLETAETRMDRLADLESKAEELRNQLVKE